MSALEVTGLCVTAGAAKGSGIPVVADVAMIVAAGELVAVVGETGAGKTMSVLSMLGLGPRGCHVTGSLRVGGRDIDLGKPADLRDLRGRRVGLVLQDPRSMFDPVLPVGKQITEAAIRRKWMSPEEAAQRSVSLMREVGFARPEDVFRLYPHQLSGGMLQRAALAMTLMPNPAVLIADEPTSALDANLRWDVLELFRKLARDFSMGILIVSHDLGLVQQSADRIIVMYSGRVVEEGPVSGVVNAPRHPYTKALLDCTLRIDGAGRTQLPTIPGVPPPSGSMQGCCPFSTRCGLVMDICRELEPAWEQAGDRGARCHLSGQDGGEFLNGGG